MMAAYLPHVIISAFVFKTVRARKMAKYAHNVSIVSTVCNAVKIRQTFTTNGNEHGMQ